MRGEVCCGGAVQVVEERRLWSTGVPAWRWEQSRLGRVPCRCFGAKKWSMRREQLHFSHFTMRFLRFAGVFSSSRAVDVETCCCRRFAACVCAIAEEEKAARLQFARPTPD